MDKKTKIVTTIGPASDSAETMEALILAGANVFRFNMKHGTVAWHEERIKRADEVAKRLNKTLGILVDLQGPEIRLETKEKKDVEVKKGESVTFYKSFETADTLLCLPHDIIFTLATPGKELLIDDGFLEFDITEVTPTSITAVSRDNYIIHHRKGVNFPGLDIDLPSLIDADLQKLDLASIAKVDFIALSFVRRKADVEVLRAEMEKRKLKAAVIAKIESQQSLDNFDEILEASDGIMVGRGDLGVETPIEELAFWQKQLVYRCRIAAKPVIVATQMLQSMVEAPRPTRAEATDVSNAVWDGTDAIMLSAESANGKYPIKAVETMNKIAMFNESHSFVASLPPFAETATQAVAGSAMKIITDNTNIAPKALVVLTSTGETARVISSHRPNVPVIAVSNSQKTVEELSLSYGIKPYFTSSSTLNSSAPSDLLSELEANGILQKGDLVLLVHGQNWLIPGSTNSLALLTV